ncbi:hypothetical protein EI94DRAFT_1703081 [Lactarius quietus]|nr:hypothetical protein EI94DRAFT_1703081 [Lactarius quietus]
MIVLQYQPKIWGCRNVLVVPNVHLNANGDKCEYTRDRQARRGEKVMVKVAASEGSYPLAIPRLMMNDVAQKREHKYVNTTTGQDNCPPQAVSWSGNHEGTSLVGTTLAIIKFHQLSRAQSDDNTVMCCHRCRYSYTLAALELQRDCRVTLTGRTKGEATERGSEKRNRKNDDVHARNGVSAAGKGAKMNGK